LADGLADIIAGCSNLLSHETLAVEVITPERVISKETTAQQALGSLMGLIMPTSGCPHLAIFKPMARFHLPFSSAEETIYRVSSMYLLAQYFLGKAGKRIDPEFSELGNISESIHTVNRHFAQRLRAATKGDSSVNALTALDLFIKLLSYSLDDSLEELRYLFQPYLSALEQSSDPTKTD
jgi:hypothetical protein